MRARHIFSCILAVSLALTACKKDKEGYTQSCQDVKEALKNESKEVLRAQIDRLIGQLSDKHHNQANLEALVTAINGQCGLQAAILCVQCIKTLPPQSEISITFSENGSQIRRTIDISSTQSDDMRFSSVHQ
ncbi:hypothetical protein [Paraflavitalea sp. CAU 1676]|uniref:hypothetical protein n=1 Tax=Paraflavitalea sp. CAU 1676 TaxID=3032598 RepID=UPI0023DC9C3D|nr:hypothetical protein [Paraflavitalea sp. CAU 1676]MDF2188107.1 hypothetical protein [Paraflavitalea sp. CAU 1676]